MNLAEDDELTSDLRAQLRRRHRQLQAVGPGPWPEDLIVTTLDDTVALLNLRQKHAAQAAEQHRAEGARVIRIVAQSGSAILAIEGIAVLTGLLGLSWITAFGLLLIGTLGIWSTEKNRTVYGQKSRLVFSAISSLPKSMITGWQELDGQRRH